MNVGVLIGNLSPTEGGGWTFVEEILRWLPHAAARSKHSVTVLGRCSAEHLPRFEATSIRVHAFPHSTGQRILSKAREVLRYFGASRTPRNHLDGVCEQLGIEFLWFPDAHGVCTDTPYLATVWDLQHRVQPWFPEVSSGGTWDHREQFHARFLRRAAAIAACNAVGRAEIRDAYGISEERIHLLPLPAPSFAPHDLERNPAEVLQKYSLAPGFLFYPAQFWPHKNHANLLKALATLHREHDLRLHAVFTGSDKGNRGYVETLTKDLGLDAYVHVLGFVPTQDLVALYRQALALCFPSFFGPENLPPLEAFTLGCPVIASRVAGAEHQLQSCALLVDPTRPEDFALAIKRLHLDHDLRAALIRSGQARAAQWTGKDYVERVFAILDEFAPIRCTWAAR
jgi:glycosyltransferase involved in cell wall biosynthesis